MTNMLQIQPQFALRDEWAALVQQEQLSYELIEPFMPELLSDSEKAAQVLHWYAQSGRVRSLHGAFIDCNIASGDPKVRAVTQTRYRESCRMAAELGAAYVVFHSTCFPFLRAAYLDNWVGKSAQLLTELAEQYPSLIICMENSMDVDTTPLLHLMRRVSHARVRVCLDIGHTQYTRAAMETWFDDLGEYIQYIHLSDNGGLFDDHLSLGAGVVDWIKADRLYRQLGRSTPITLEVGSIDNVKDSLAYLRGNGLFGLGD